MNRSIPVRRAYRLLYLSAIKVATEGYETGGCSRCSKSILCLVTARSARDRPGRDSAARALMGISFFASVKVRRNSANSNCLRGHLSVTKNHQSGHRAASDIRVRFLKNLKAGLEARKRTRWQAFCIPMRQSNQISAAKPPRYDRCFFLRKVAHRSDCASSLWNRVFHSGSFHFYP